MPYRWLGKAQNKGRQEKHNEQARWHINTHRNGRSKNAGRVKWKAQQERESQNGMAGSGHKGRRARVHEEVVMGVATYGNTMVRYSI